MFMSISVLQEMDFLKQSIICGISITFAYDWLRIARNLWKHNNIAISIEDSLYWIACSLFVFMILHQENNGILRWFAVIGATIGMILYKLSVSRLFIKILTSIGMKMQEIMRKVKTPALFLKKKLTVRRKLFKMMISKK